MLRNPHLDAALFACGSMVLNYPLYAFFRAMRGKTHTDPKAVVTNEAPRILYRRNDA